MFAQSMCIHQNIYKIANWNVYSVSIYETTNCTIMVLDLTLKSNLCMSVGFLSALSVVCRRRKAYINVRRNVYHTERTNAKKNMNETYANKSFYSMPYLVRV